jgi:predicted nucleic acid-binding Zn finger protein
VTITVSTADPRSVKALKILETADRWQRGHLKESGRSFFAIPSSTDPSTLYMVDGRECSCPDFIRRQQCCKHVLAVRLWLAREQAPKPKPAPAARYQDRYGSDGDGSPAYRHPASCPCDSCWDAADERDGTHTERTERRGRVPLVGRLLA